MKKIWILPVVLISMMIGYVLAPLTAPASIPQTASQVTAAGAETDNAAQAMRFTMDSGQSMLGPGTVSVSLPYGMATTGAGKTTAFIAGQIPPITITLTNMYLVGAQVGNVGYLITSGNTVVSQGSYPAATPVNATMRAEFASFANTVEGLLAPLLPGAPTPNTL